MKNTTRNKIIVFGVLLPLMFGFIFWGGGGTGSGLSSGIISSNKVIAPSFGAGISGSLRFSTAPAFRPAFQAIRLNSFGSFRWNFFDP